VSRRKTPLLLTPGLWDNEASSRRWAAYRKRLESRPASQQAVSQEPATLPELRQLGAIDRRLGHDRQAVEKALPGGSGAPGPVFVRNASEVVGFTAMSTCDESVTAD